MPPKKHTVKIKTQKAFEKELKKNEFRVAIFGSARIDKKDKIYKLVYELAKEIGQRGFDIVTGGGPGLMEAANAGHEEGDEKRKADSIGLTIQLPWEPKNNLYLELERHFHRFSNRLDNFMALSKVVVVTPGGIGTCLELFFTLQLIQVKHIKPIPIILVGDMWKKLMTWLKKYPIKQGLISKEDLNEIHIAKNKKQAMKIINEHYALFTKSKKTSSAKSRKSS